MPIESRKALPECDLVMKGGITSGIVYPPAIQEVARKYRFRQIGGTSAGAIAAACAAAAEFGSESGKPDAGFDGLGKVSDWLGAGTNLLDLFQPSAPTRPLFKTFLAIAATGKQGEKPSFPVLALRAITRLTVAFARYELPTFLMGMLIGMVIELVLRWLTIRGAGASQLFPHDGWPLVWELIGLLVCGWLGGLIFGIVGLFRIAVQKVPQNFFGMCSGRGGFAGGKRDTCPDGLAPRNDSETCES